MKILYHHRTKAADGMSVHIRELTAALKAEGADILMCGPGGDKGATQALSAGEGDGKGLKDRLPKPLYELAEFFYSAPAFLRLRKAYQEYKPDFVYERHNVLFLAGAWLKKVTGAPFILEVNAPLYKERLANEGFAFKSLAKWSEEAAWRAADYVLPVTQVLAKDVEAAGVPRDKIVVIHNGANPAFLADVDAGPVREKYGLQGKTVLGFMGFVRPWHGLDRVIRFLAAEGRSDLHLFIVGGGPARDGLEALAAELGVSDQTTFAGVVQRDAAAAHVAAFDIALQPAVTPYASPLKLFEYMGLGKAIIAPDTDNIKEILSSDENARLFRSEDFDDFIAQLKVLCDDAGLRARLGAGARAAILDNDRTWAGNARRVLALGEDLVQKKRAKG